MREKAFDVDKPSEVTLAYIDVGLSDQMGPLTAKSSIHAIPSALELLFNLYFPLCVMHTLKPNTHTERDICFRNKGLW